MGLHSKHFAKGHSGDMKPGAVPKKTGAEPLSERLKK